MKRWWLLKVAKFIVIFSVIVVGLGFIVMQLWNMLIPELFKGPEITFLQSIGLLLLSHILFRGGPHHWHSRHRERWRKHWEQKLASMSPDEREKLKAEWKRRCGWYQEETEEKKSTA